MRKNRQPPEMFLSEFSRPKDGEGPPRAVDPKVAPPATATPPVAVPAPNAPQVGTQERAEGQPSGTLAIEISVDLVDPSPYQPRTHFDEDTLVLLAESMECGTQINPITVRPKSGGRYELIGGERRWRALKMNGRATIFAVVRSISDSEARLYAVTDNEARDSLSDYERGIGFQMLLDSGDAANHSDLSRKIGVERSAITRCLAFQQLPQSVLAYFKKSPRIFGSRYVADFLRFCEKDEDLVVKAVERIYLDGKDALSALNWLKGESTKRHHPAPVKDHSKWQIAGRTFGELNTQGSKLLIAPSQGYSPATLQRFLTSLWDEAPDDVRSYLTNLIEKCSVDEVRE